MEKNPLILECRARTRDKKLKEERSALQSTLRILRETSQKKGVSAGGDVAINFLQVVRVVSRDTRRGVAMLTDHNHQDTSAGGTYFKKSTECDFVSRWGDHAPLDNIRWA